MITDRIDLYEYFGIDRPLNAKGYLNFYVHNQPDEHCKDRLRPAMLVIGGGGYEFISNRETEPVALAYMVKGFNAFTLDYSVKPVKFPSQLIEGAMAIAYIKENADKLNIDANYVAAIGFSAGGHLCSMLATMFNSQEVLSALKCRANLCRPDAVILSYPVITMGKYTHVGSMECITGGKDEIKEKISSENNVNKSSSPAFIWATVNDGSVPVENSLMIAQAYRKAGVDFELHLFPSGVHGLSLASLETANRQYQKDLVNETVAKWFDLSITFLRDRNFNIKI